MTAGEQVLAISSLSSGSAADLLLHPIEGSPSGEIIFKPTDSFITEISNYNLQANLDIISISSNLSKHDLTGDIPVVVLSADLTETNLEGSLCQ